MDAALLARLDRLRLHRTRYELAALLPDGRRVLMAYCQPSRPAGIAAARSRAAARELRGALENLALAYTRDKSPDKPLAGHILCYHSGRTQREAILSGELPFILDEPPAAEPGAECGA